MLIPGARSLAAQEAEDRPPAKPRFGVGDAVGLPFKIATFPISVVFNGIFFVTEAVTLPGPPNFFTRTVRSLENAGIHPTVGSIGTRSGVAVTFNFVELDPFFVETGISVKGSQRHRAGIRFGDPTTSGVELAGKFQRDAQLTFWGIGGDTPEEDRSLYRRETTSADLGVWTSLGPVFLRGGVGFESNRLDSAFGTDDDEQLTAVFEGRLPFGTEDRAKYVREDLGATLDFTQRSGFQTRGVQLFGGVTFFQGIEGTETDFHRVTGEFHTYLPLNPRQTLALRGFAEANRIDEGTEIEFYQLARVGSIDGLRGYSPNRFTNNDGFGAQAEWRYEVWRDLYEKIRAEFFVFYEVGGVAERLSDISDAEVHDSWGFGMRMATLDNLVGYMYLGLGGEDTRFRIGNQITF